MSIKDKVVETKNNVSKKYHNAEEIVNAVSISTTVAFTGYQAYQHRTESIAWVLLGAAAAWSVFQAFKAWNTVLNK